MDIIKRWLAKSNKKQLSDERDVLLKELRKAKHEWIAAREKMDNVLDFKEIDYAIYAFEAAERRYDMLLKEAKEKNLNLLHEQNGVEG